jgi:signal transduction histidine kinase/ActR/RegA family two-component response regulator
MRRLRLRTLLLVLVLVTSIPVALFAAWVVSRSSAQQEALIDRQNVEQARAVVVAVDQELESTVAALGVLALLDPIDSPDKRHFEEIASRVLLLHPGWQSIRLVDTNLQVLASTAGPTVDSPVVNPDWVTQVIATGRPSFSNAVQRPGSTQLTVTVGVPVIRGVKLTYVLGARLHGQAFSNLLKRQKVPPGGVVTLLDRTPKIIARTMNEDLYVGKSPTRDFMARSREEPEGSWRTVLLEGTTAYSAWSRSDLSGWTVGVGVPAEPVDGPVRRSYRAVVAAGFAMFAAGLVLALVLGRGLVRTQEAVLAAARSLARGEAAPPFESRIAESQALAEGLREASAVLRQRERERDEAQAEADRHRTALLERETAARRAAETLNRAKDEFIATVSHELRTPLNAIYGWVAMLRTGTLDPARQAHALEVIDRNTRAQSALVEDLLDMSRAIQGSLRLGMEPLDLAVVLDAAIESLRPTAAARQIAVEAQAERGVAFVSGDPGRVQQVLWNLLSNALKFTAPGGRIDARVDVADGAAVVSIRDSGQGIAREFLPHVFDRFRQEDATVTRTHSGLGLGLSLVRHLVELHGGVITAESEGKGRGATFTIRLPLLGARAHADAASPDVALADGAAGLRDRHVVVVDDDGDTRELAAAALGMSGAVVVTAASAQDAFTALESRTPDAIVADISMPGVSGYDLERRLRDDQLFAELPIVALTAHGGADARDNALAAGFSAYMRKPYDPRALSALLAGLIAARDAQV